jgi:hypothetical protein
VAPTTTTTYPCVRRRFKACGSSCQRTPRRCRALPQCCATPACVTRTHTTRPYARVHMPSVALSVCLHRPMALSRSHSMHHRPTPSLSHVHASFVPEQLVVLGEALGAARGARLDLAGTKTDHQVGNKRVLCLAAAVAHHHAPASRLRQQRPTDTHTHTFPQPGRGSKRQRDRETERQRERHTYNPRTCQSGRGGPLSLCACLCTPLCVSLSLSGEGNARRTLEWTRSGCRSG